jgi:hypothetical protein
VQNKTPEEFVNNKIDFKKSWWDKETFIAGRLYIFNLDHDALPIRE